MTTRYTEAEVRAAVESAPSLSAALRTLGLRAAGGNFGTLRSLIDRYGISTAHMHVTWTRRGNWRARRTPIEELLVEGSTYCRTSLKRRLYDEGLKARQCELCGQGELWRGKTMGLILDHINGVADDNRLENLRIACPNCAATFETHCGRHNRIRYEPRDCLHCGTSFTPKADRQRYCSQACGARHGRGISHPERRKVERPPCQQLLAEIDALGWSAVGRKYGVSDNAVRKWVRWYEAERDASGDAEPAPAQGDRLAVPAAPDQAARSDGHPQFPAECGESADRDGPLRSERATIRP